jgi:hypothetical protein
MAESYTGSKKYLERRLLLTRLVMAIQSSQFQAVDMILVCIRTTT